MQFRPPNVAEVFTEHVVCLRCGYDLFGLPRHGVCPECGEDVAAASGHAHCLALPGNRDRLRRGAWLLLSSSLLCGFCPGVCLFALSRRDVGLVAVLMTLIFGATAATSALGDWQLRSIKGVPETRSPWATSTLDIVAGIGLALINLAAYFGVSRGRFDTSGWVLIGVGFFLLDCVAFRATLAARRHAAVAKACLGRRCGLQGLGTVKAYYETVWLASCWGALACLAGRNGVGVILAVGAFFGLCGFGIVWIAMVSTHARFVGAVQRLHLRGKRGFDVIARA